MPIFFVDERSGFQLAAVLKFQDVNGAIEVTLTDNQKVQILNAERIVHFLQHMAEHSSCQERQHIGVLIGAAIRAAMNENATGDAADDEPIIEGDEN